MVSCLSVDCKTAGMVIDAITPIITRVIRTSINVKPFTMQNPHGGGYFVYS